MDLNVCLCLIPIIVSDICRPRESLYEQESEFRQKDPYRVDISDDKQTIQSLCSL